MENLDFNELTPNEIDGIMISDLSAEDYKQLWRAEWRLNSAVIALYEEYVRLTKSHIAAGKLLELQFTTLRTVGYKR